MLSLLLLCLALAPAVAQDPTPAPGPALAQDLCKPGESPSENIADLTVYLLFIYFFLYFCVEKYIKYNENVLSSCLIHFIQI